MRTVCLALLLLAVAAAPAAAVDRAQATRIALREFDGRPGPLVVFALRKPIGPRTTLSEAGSTLGVRTSSVQRGFRTITASRIPHPRAGHRAWLFWADGAPGAYFPHNSGLVLVDARSGRVVRRQDMSWELLVNRRRPAFLSSAKDYLGKRYRVLTRGGAARRAATATATSFGRTFLPDPTFGPPLKAVADDRLQGPESSPECMFLLRDKFDTETFGGNLDAQKKFASDQGAILYDAANGDTLDKDLTDAEERGCNDAVVAIDAHGVPPKYAASASVLLRGDASENPNQPLVDFSIKKGDTIRGEWFTSVNFRDIAKAHPDVTFKLIIDACHAGQWLDDLKFDPLPNLVLQLAAAKAQELAWGDPGGADKFWKVIIDHVPPNAGQELPPLIYDAVKVNYTPRADRPPQHPQGVSATQGTFDDGSDLQVSGQVVQCSASLGVAVNGAFAPDNVWGTGGVDVPPTDKVFNGYTAYNGNSFGRPCQKPVTLTATPDRGMEFVGWADGCSGNALTCTLTMPGKGAKVNVVAAFAPREWTITVNNTNTDGGTARGSGGIFPPIWCGTYYNGPTVQKNTQCSSPARAAAQANDTRTIVFEPNVQGPGDTRAEWEVDHVDGCDVVTPGGHGAQCSILLEADRTVTVSWKRVN